MTLRYIKHFLFVYILFEAGLQGLSFSFFREFIFGQLGTVTALTLLWNSFDILFLLLIIAGFFKYLKQDLVSGVVGYFRWLFCSFGLMLAFNVRLGVFFYAEEALVLKIEIFDFDYGIFLARVFLIIAAIFFLILLYFDVTAKNLFVIELPFIVGLLLWFFLLSVRSFNFLFLFLLMESITLLLVVILSVYFMFFGARLLKPVIHFFVFNLVISTFFLLGLGVLFFIIPVSGSENISYLMILINFWSLSISGFVDPFLILFVFKFSIACFLIPFLFKITISPFSFWVVNIYSKLPVIFLFIVMGVYKFIYILLFLKFFLQILDLVSVFQGTITLSVVWCVIPSMFVGCIAYRSADLKTILALTTVSQMGYIVGGLVSHDIMAMKYAIIYLVVYILNLSGVFIIFVKLQKEFFLTNLNQLFFVKYYSKKWFYVLFILFASLAGFPPFAGFFLKYFLFLHIYKSGFFILSVAGVISGYIMSIVYLQILMELAMVKHLPWAQYQAFLLGGLSYKFNQSKRLFVHHITNPRSSQNIYRVINYSLICLFVINVFFIIFLPLLSYYFGMFTFFFVYGLFLNTELGPVKAELVWFANGFSEFPIAVEQNTPLEKFYTHSLILQQYMDLVLLTSEKTLEGPVLLQNVEPIPERIGKEITQAWLTDGVGRQAEQFVLSFDNGRTNSLASTGFIMAWYTPSLTLEEYMEPINNFAICTRAQIFVNGVSNASEYDFLVDQRILLPYWTKSLASEDFYFSYSAVSLGSMNSLRDFRLFVTENAYDVINPRLFGYSHWDTYIARIHIELGYPQYTFNEYFIKKYPEFYVGLTGAKEPEWDKLVTKLSLQEYHSTFAKRMEKLCETDLEIRTYYIKAMKGVMLQNDLQFTGWYR